MTLLTALIIAVVVGKSIGQPILPYQAYPPYQLVYLSPPQVPYQVIRDPQPILNNRVSDRNDDSDEIIAQSEGYESDEQYEVSQFHSEDENGRVVFGFNSPDQIRMEARDADGTVRGSYSYIDANGNIVRMHYWDDGSGFHAAGNNLPVAVHQVPQYTPEVQAARDEHFKLYEAALASLQSAMTQSAGGSSEDENPIIGDYAEQPTYDSDLDNPSDDTVIIENGAQHEIRPQYPKYPQYVQPSVPNQDVVDDDKESIAIENPEFKINLPQWVVRQAKSNMKEKKPLDTKINENKSKKPENPINIEKKIDIFPDLGEYDPITKEITGGNRAFYYHFKHLVPLDKPEQKPSASSVSVRAKQAGGIPVAAVHDAQVSPSQKDSIPNVQIYPVYNHKESDDKKTK